MHSDPGRSTSASTGSNARKLLGLMSSCELGRYWVVDLHTLFRFGD
jgi:hypothetical protein